MSVPIRATPMNQLSNFPADETTITYLLFGDKRQLSVRATLPGAFELKALIIQWKPTRRIRFPIAEIHFLPLV